MRASPVSQEAVRCEDIMIESILYADADWTKSNYRLAPDVTFLRVTAVRLVNTSRPALTHLLELFRISPT
ncbi:MAG: hypothetical protein E6J34_00270 [Chloroflexi bacterium]|nr:MAG: hypothetical protein E6J34_00270 [Chloroflexota bacterium]